MQTRAPDLNKIFGVNTERERYLDNEQLVTLDNQNSVQEYQLTLENNLPIKFKMVPPKKGSSISTAVFTRGSWFKKHTIGLRVQNDHAAFLDGYFALELTFSKFLSFESDTSDRLEDNTVTKGIFVDNFNSVNLEFLPELMYWIHSRFTYEPHRWVRFKRLFTSIDLTIDPVIVETVKYKLARYITNQRRIISLNEKRRVDGNGEILSTDQYLTQKLDKQVLHKVMDMLVFMPYCYLFPVFKAMATTTDMSGFELPVPENSQQ